MLIKSIRIKNFRNFGKSAFELELKPFTLILGENNVGKSNLLNAIGLIFSQDLSAFRRRMLEIDDFNYSTVESFKKEVANEEISPKNIKFPEVQIDVILSDMDDKQNAVVADWFINSEMEKAGITYLFTTKGSFDKEAWIENQREKLETFPIDFPIEEYRYSIFGGNDSTNECQQYLLRMLKMEYLDALRDAEQELVASGSARLLYRVLSQSELSEYGDIKKASGDLAKAINKNESLKRVKEQIEKLLSRVSLVSGSDGNNIDFRVSSPEVSELLKKISLIYGANPIDLSRNGLGRNNLLYIALVLSHLSAKDKRGSDTYFRCIGIEEPEAHLHPQLQDHLADNIESIHKDNSSKMQLLLTSHSTHIASKLNLKNTVILYDDKTSIKGHYVLAGLDRSKNKKHIRYLSKFIDATKSRLFFARKIILVEGISEKILMPVFFKQHFKVSLEQSGYEIVNVQGVAFQHFLKIIKNGYFIKCLVFTDSDSGTKVENRAENLQKEFKDIQQIRVEVSETSTFEKDLINANRDGAGKKILLKALEETKPIKGKEFKADTGDSKIDVDKFFEEIENYKSEFALNLKRRFEKDGDGFVLPTYITKGFGFLEEESEKK